MAWLPTGEIDTDETVRTMPEGSPLPPAVYTGFITKTQQKNTQSGEGVYVEVEFSITTPVEFSARKFWDRFNIINKSDVAQKIGRDCIADLAKACGIKKFSDDEQLMNHEVMMELYIEPAKPYTDKNGVAQAGKPQNKCGKYWPMGTDVETAKKAYREAQKSGVTRTVANGAPAATAQPGAAAPANKWGTGAQAPAPQQHAGAAANTPAANLADKPWKRNKQ